ncbi:MAG TPA: RDD family protein [Gallionellaceae bacterium]|nr:RDD family protein [Gallionellaceae bacterium]
MELVGTAPASNRAAKPAELIYAGWWVRFLAAFLDLLVLGAWTILIMLGIAGLIAYSGQDSILGNHTAISAFYWAIVCMSLAYYILMESGTQGATFGKRWMNIKVMKIDGNRLSVTRALLRLIARVFSHLLLMSGFLIQSLMPRKQALHDLLAGTIVVRANENRKISIKASLLVLFFALMIPLLALFATVGLPFFQQQVMKVQLENGMQIGMEATLAASRYYLQNRSIPAVIGDASGDIELSPHVSEIAVNQQNGAIILTFSDTVRKAISNKHLIFTPTLEADQSLSWKCSSADIEARFLPATCQ